MELFARHGSITGEEYGKQVYVLPKVLDEKVARLHLDALNAHLTELSKEQAEYLGVDVAGPYKPDHYPAGVTWLRHFVLSAHRRAGARSDIRASQR